MALLPLHRHASLHPALGANTRKPSGLLSLESYILLSTSSPDCEMFAGRILGATRLTTPSILTEFTDRGSYCWSWGFLLDNHGRGEHFSGISGARWPADSSGMDHLRPQPLSADAAAREAGRLGKEAMLVRSCCREGVAKGTRVPGQRDQISTESKGKQEKEVEGGRQEADT